MPISPASGCQVSRITRMPATTRQSLPSRPPSASTAKSGRRAAARVPRSRSSSSTRALPRVCWRRRNGRGPRTAAASSSTCTRAKAATETAAAAAGNLTSSPSAACLRARHPRLAGWRHASRTRVTPVHRRSSTARASPAASVSSRRAQRRTTAPRYQTTTRGT